MAAEDDDYKVGYKNPPRQHQFKKGQSGNPKGRPKGSKKTLQDELMKALNKKVPVIENGKTKKITMREAIAKGLVNKSARGDTKALNQLVKLMPPEEGGSGEPQILKYEFSWMDSNKPKIGEDD